jgi:hypothetical protein
LVGSNLAQTYSPITKSLVWIAALLFLMASIRLVETGKGHDKAKHTPKEVNHEEENKPAQEQKSAYDQQIGFLHLKPLFHICYPQHRFYPILA